MSSKLTIFWKYLEEHKVKIPIIQRDYAQGRENETEKRKRFLNSLYKALTDGDPLKLDFVYGTNVDNAMQPLDGQQRLTTLWLLHWYFAAKVGMTGKNTDVSNILKRFSYETRSSSRDFCEKLSEFQPTWPKNSTGSNSNTSGNAEGAPSNSSESAEEKTPIENNEAALTILFKRQKSNKSNESAKAQNIAEQIKNQTWFNSAWIQDPTISSMLRMLSGDDNCDNDAGDNIEAVFGKIDSTDTWKRFTESNGNTCPICFYEFDMGEYGLTDDLYIKMNARGEQLSACENFKADLLGYIQRQSDAIKNGQANPWEPFLNPIDGIAAKWDNQWTDIFWDKRLRLPQDRTPPEKRAPSDFEKKWANRVDEIFFAFINRFWLNYGIAYTEQPIPDDAIYNISFYTYDKENQRDSYKKELEYSNFEDNYTIIRREGNGDIKIDVSGILQALTKVFKNYNKFPLKQIDSYLSATWDKKDNCFIPKYNPQSNDNQYPILAISQSERVAFFAICKFLETATDGEKNIADKFVDWMRVVWNIIEDADIDTVQKMIRTLRLIKTLSEGSHDILTYINEHRDELCNINYDAVRDQVREECLKAQLIIENKKLIIENKINWKKAIIDAESLPFARGKIIAFLRAANENGKYNFDKFNDIYIKCKEAFPILVKDSAESQKKWEESFKNLLSWCTDKDLDIKFAYDFTVLKNSIFAINFDDDDWAIIKYFRNSFSPKPKPQAKWVEVLLRNWSDLKPFEKDSGRDKSLCKHGGMVYLYRTKNITRAFWLSQDNIDFLKQVVGDDWQHGTTDGIYRWVSISDDGNVEVAADHDGIISKRSRETVITWNELWEKVGNNNDIMDVVKKAIDVANKNID